MAPADDETAPTADGHVVAVVVMGVTGAGKSTVGRALASRLGWTYVDGDDAHPASNVDKMRRGIPLDDADRLPWLRTLHADLTERLARGDHVVLACSALTATYRAVLVGDLRGVAFAYLSGTEELLADRLRRRRGHFMAPSLLTSQLAILEPPARAVTVDVSRPVDQSVREIVAVLGLGEGGTS